MGRLRAVQSKVKPLAARLKPAGEPEGNYGQGRGGRPWRRLRLQVFARDGYTCRHCDRTYPASQLACDHIVPQSKGGSDDMGNLQTLCDGPGSCHEAKSKAEASGNEFHEYARESIR